MVWMGMVGRIIEGRDREGKYSSFNKVLTN